MLVPWKRLHHVGYVTNSVESAIAYYTDSFGYSLQADICPDPVQKVRIAFVAAENAVLIELIEPAAEDSPVSKFAEKGGGLHHMCYEVENLAETLSGIREQKGIILGEPVPAPALDNRRIAFAYTHQRLLVEFVEVKPGAGDIGANDAAPDQQKS